MTDGRATTSGDVGAALALLRDASGGRVEVARTVADAPLVVAHGREGDNVFFAVFRFEGGRVARRWRFATPVASANASGHSQIDGSTGPDPAVNGEESKALVRRYYEAVHIAGQHDEIDAFMSDDVQVRHEPGVRDGVAAFKADLAMLTRDRTINRIVLLAAQGDLVFVAAHGTHAGEPCAYLDLYRVAAGRLVEHWGFPQPLPPGEAFGSGDRP